MTSAPTSKWLNAIERIGNRLPDPITLFFLGAVLVTAASQIADWADWTVVKTVRGEAGTTTTTEVKAVGLLSGDGLNWAIASLVDNFTGFAPLGIVLVGMLGIGVAEKTGGIGALLKLCMLITPRRLLTPAMLFVGIMSSMALDAGYVVLPPIAAALYASVGRSPLAGLAAVFAGVSAGFSANLFITALDPLLAGFSQEGAQLIDPQLEVAATCNWWFMIVSTVLLTFVGWAVTAWWVEPRYAGRPGDEGGPPSPSASDGDVTADANNGELHTLSAAQKRGLIAATSVFAVVSLALLAMAVIEGGPLHGQGRHFDRWVEAIVPMLFFVFVLPGVAYGIAAGEIRSDRDVARLMSATMVDMAPYIVLAFFAAQFVAYFGHSNLGQMLALTGGSALAAADLPGWLLIAAFIAMVMGSNLFIGSASAKYAFFAPVFVPMFMQGASLSPALTQAAYRVGDSVTNIITPLNPYLIIILVFIQKYVPRAGIGTLVALMLPYTIVFAIVWTAMLLFWWATGLDLGPAGALIYEAAP